MLWLKIGSNRPKSAQTVISHSLKSYLSRIYCITPLLWAYIIQLIIMPIFSVMLHYLQRCITESAQRSVHDASRLHQRCSLVAFTLHPRCIHVAAWLHQRCITVRVRKLQPSCNQAATLGERCMYRSCTVHARYLWVAISRRYCMFPCSLASIGRFKHIWVQKW